MVHYYVKVMVNSRRRRSIPLKKVGFVLVIVIGLFSVFILFNKLHYPSLPIENLSAKEVIEKLEESNSEIVELAIEEDTIWYITRAENQGVSLADEHIKQLIGSHGWEFIEKDGSGLFFEKNGDRLIATTEMWTKKYILVKVQSKFNKI